MLLPPRKKCPKSPPGISTSHPRLTETGIQSAEGPLIGPPTVPTGKGDQEPPLPPTAINPSAAALHSHAQPPEGRPHVPIYTSVCMCVIGMS